MMMHRLPGIVVSAILITAPPGHLMPHASATPPLCECQHAKALQADLNNARLLEERFRNKIAELKPLSRAESRYELKKFAETEARNGLEPVPGPDRVDYTTRGEAMTRIETILQRRKDLERAKRNNDLPTVERLRQEDIALCERSDQGVLDLTRAEAASVCHGMARAIRTHEDFHLATCRDVGYDVYAFGKDGEGVHGADRASEEASAYAATSAFLAEQLSKAPCDYKVDSQYSNGPVSVSWSGKKCEGASGEWTLLQKHRYVGPDGTVASEITRKFTLDARTLRGAFADEAVQTISAGGAQGNCTYALKGEVAFVYTNEPQLEFMTNSTEQTCVFGDQRISMTYPSSDKSATSVQSGSFCP
jgi:hypothetical protein